MWEGRKRLLLFINVKLSSIFSLRYLYWVIQGIPDGGIYQVDLADLGKVLLHQRDSNRLVLNYRLSAFMVDYKKFSVLYPDEMKNAMMSLSLYGYYNATDIRANTQSPNFKNIISLTSHKELFYWTDGNDLIGEQYHNSEDKYYHNAISFVQDQPLSRLVILHPDSQPYPGTVCFILTSLSHL